MPDSRTTQLRNSDVRHGRPVSAISRSARSARPPTDSARSRGGPRSRESVVELTLVRKTPQRADDRAEDGGHGNLRHARTEHQRETHTHDDVVNRLGESGLAGPVQTTPTIRNAWTPRTSRSDRSGGRRSPRHHRLHCTPAQAHKAERDRVGFSARNSARPALVGAESMSLTCGDAPFQVVRAGRFWVAHGALPERRPLASRGLSSKPRAGMGTVH